MHQIKSILLSVNSIFLTCFFLLQTANAQSLSTSTMLAPKASSFSELKPKLAFEITSLNYASSSDVDEKSQGRAEVTFGVKKEGFFFADLEITLGTFSEPKSLYIPAPEAYLAIGNEKSNFVAVGIKKQSYSFVDQFYHLGMYQSYQTNDFIDYKEQGLAGLQVQATNGMIGFKGGFQPIFLKNQGPEVHEQDGSITSSNRWATRPPKRFEFIAGKQEKIEYVIRDYDVMDILSHQGQTLSVFLGPDTERPWIQASYAKHPLNEIPLTRETYGTASDFTGHVFLSPVPTDHEVKSADINLDSGNFKSTLSYLEDKPVNSEPLPDETLQYLNPLKVLAVFISYDFKDYVSRNLSVSLAAAEMQGGEIKDIVQGGGEGVFTFSSQRTIFKKPLSLGITGDLLYIGTKPLLTTLSWTYDREYKGSLISSKLAYETWKRIYLQGGFDLLGVENELPADAPQNFLSQNQANDRFFAGVKYVF